MDKKQLRRNFNALVLKRDGNKCRVCGRSDGKLDVHHITDRHEMPNGGYVIENGITLCDNEGGCHWQAELFHISGNQQALDGFHPDDLYKLIGSDYEKAFYASEKLIID